MRYFLSKREKKKLFLALKQRYNLHSIKELSLKLKISIKTLQGWFYDKYKTIPDHILDKEMLNILKIKDKKEDNWGQVKGGKISFNKNLKGNQSKGGINSAINKSAIELKNFKPNLEDKRLLELYGVLLGDGWLSNFKSCGKEFWIIGICTNLTLEKSYSAHYKKLVNDLLNRDGWFRHNEKNNVLEFMFSHKLFLKYLNRELGFPIGRKEGLIINKKITDLGFDKVRYVIRGIFDTDGSFYLTKNSKGGKDYPNISFHMNEPKLIKQIGNLLENEGFKVIYSNGLKMIKIKGSNQLKLWMELIGSSNPYKYNKMVRLNN